MQGKDTIEKTETGQTEQTDERISDKQAKPDSTGEPPLAVLDQTKPARQTRRVYMIVKHFDPEARQDAWEHPGAVVARALRFLEVDEAVTVDSSSEDDTADCRLMMVERFTWYTFVVFDLFHAAYDFQTAHLPSASQPPVTVLFHGRPKDKVDALASCHHVFRLPALDDISPKLQKMAGSVNFALQLAHGNHGWMRRPPFRHDHANNVLSSSGCVPKRPRPIPF